MKIPIKKSNENEEISRDYRFLLVCLDLILLPDLYPFKKIIIFINN